MLDATGLTAAIRQFGVLQGDLLVFEGLTIATSKLVGGFDRLQQALITAVGEKGTIVVPTCTPSEGYPKSTFDPRLSPSEMGPFSEYFRSLPGVVRSHNPTHSLASIGPQAVELISDHRSAWGRPSPWGDGSLGVGSPWDYLYDHNAWWVLVGEDCWATPFAAYVQARFRAEHSGITAKTPFPRFDNRKLKDILTREGLLYQAVWGAYEIVAFQTKDAVDETLRVLDEQPGNVDPAEEFRTWLETADYIKQKGYIQAGVAKVKITPPVPCLRWEGKSLTGVFRDLYARVVVISHGNKKIALVVCDLLGISGDLVEEIRNLVHKQIQVPKEAIQIACTHSHSTPDTSGAGFEDQVYLRFLVGAVGKGICEAVENLIPARVGWGRTEIRGLAQSRRKKLVDGKVFTTRYGVPSSWRVKSENIASHGEIDPDLTVVRIENLNGEVMCAISNFGCHASVALMSSNLSGDFPGEAMHILESALGESCVVLCTNGAAADVDPTLEMPYWGPRNDKMARRLGRIFAAQVLELLERTDVQDITPIGAEQKVVTLDPRPDWFELFGAQKDKMQQEFAEGSGLSPDITKVLDERVIRTEVQALRIADLILVGFPGEVFVESSKRLKSYPQAGAVAVVELANDNIGYLPTATAFYEGGYEVAQNLWGRVGPQAVELLVEAAREVIEQLLDSRNDEIVDQR